MARCSTPSMQGKSYRPASHTLILLRARWRSSGEA
jgi:hypothetical protein